MSSPYIEIEKEIDDALCVVVKGFSRLGHGGCQRDYDMAEVVAHIHALQDCVAWSAMSRIEGGNRRPFGGCDRGPHEGPCPDEDAAGGPSVG